MSEPQKKCRTCRQGKLLEANQEYSADLQHDGKAYTITIPNLKVRRCDQCGELMLDDHAREQVTNALRNAAGLLSPEEIRSRRDKLQLSQSELARLLEVSEATVDRWERGGQLQQRAQDKLLRLVLEVPEAREYLQHQQKPIEAASA